MVNNLDIGLFNLCQKEKGKETVRTRPKGFNSKEVYEFMNIIILHSSKIMSNNLLISRMLKVLVLCNICFYIIIGYPTKRNCTGSCFKPTVEVDSNQYYERIELIKEELLEKLGLTEPPRMRSSAVIPQVLIDDVKRIQRLQEKQEKERTEKIVILAEKVLSGSCDSCIKFTYNSNHSQYKLSNLKLWIYQKPHLHSHHGKKKHNSELNIELLNTDSKKSGSIILKSRIRASRSSWVGINIKNTKLWIPHQNLDLKLKLYCTNCTIILEDGKQPFLELTEKIKINPRRVRREVIYCKGDYNNCCMEDFVVDFERMKWDDWILSPKSFNAGQCSGTCDKSSVSSFTKHSSILKAAAIKYNETDRLKLCCTSHNLIPLNVLYRNNNGQIISQYVPNMKATSCGCS